VSRTGSILASGEGNKGRKGNGPEDRSWGPLFTDASREVREEEEMAQKLSALHRAIDRHNLPISLL
jgi:hypothetical protein